MRCRLVLLWVAGVVGALLLAGTAPAGTPGALRAPEAVHFAEISITKTRLNTKQKIVVSTTIAGLAVPGSAWRLEWKPKARSARSPRAMFSSRTTRAGRR